MTQKPRVGKHPNLQSCAGKEVLNDIDEEIKRDDFKGRQGEMAAQGINREPPCVNCNFRVDHPFPMINTRRKPSFRMDHMSLPFGVRTSRETGRT